MSSPKNCHPPKIVIYLLVSIGLPGAGVDANGKRRYRRLPQDIRNGPIVILSAQLLIRSMDVTMDDLQNATCEYPRSGVPHEPS